MFSRLVFDHSAALFTIVAFIAAFSICAAFAWGALRMKRPQLAHLESLPFATPTPAAAGPAPVAVQRPADQPPPSTPPSSAS